MQPLQVARQTPAEGPVDSFAGFWGGFLDLPKKTSGLERDERVSSPLPQHPEERAGSGLLALSQVRGQRAQRRAKTICP